MWDVHYSNNFYVCSGKDDISWGREWHRDLEDQQRAKRRVWIEAIQDHECFGQNGDRDECITCGIGGCEWYTLELPDAPTTNHDSGAERDGVATNKTVFRHQNYWDWRGRNAGGGANTYRTDHISTVAIIEQTSRFLAGGTVSRGVTRFNYLDTGNNTYRIYNLPTNYPAGTTAPVVNNQGNVSTDVNDIFIVRPTNWAVICRSRMAYNMIDYTTMGSLMFFNRDSYSLNGNIDDIQTGGFGDYIDFIPS